jgi:hypothetical protein
MQKDILHKWKPKERMGGFSVKHSKKSQKGSLYNEANEKWKEHIKTYVVQQKTV